MRSIYFRELSAYFRTPAFSVLAGVFLCLSGIFFFHSLATISLLAVKIAQGQAPGWAGVNGTLLGPLFHDMSTILILLTPLVALKPSAGAETEQTSPGPERAFAVLGGKFLAGLTVLAVIILLSSSLMALLAQVTSPDWGLVCSSYLGLLLLAGTILSLGTFFSSRTGSQIAAAAATSGLTLVFWTMGWLAPVFPASWAGGMLRELSIQNHLLPFFEGAITTRNSVFFLELSAFFLAMTALGSRRKGQEEKTGGMAHRMRTALFVIILAVGLGIVHLIIANHDRAWDLSRGRNNTLDPRTAGIVRSLSFDVRVTLYDSAGENERKARSVLQLFARESQRITYRVADPDLSPVPARSFGITRYGQAVIQARGRSLILDHAGVEEIASALFILEQGGKHHIYVLSGHGEHDLFDKGRTGLSSLAGTLERAGYGVHKSLLAGQENVPWDADLLIIPGPRSEVTPGEIDALRRYSRRGGSILMALEPGSDAGLRDFLAGVGIGLDENMVVDPAFRPLGGDDALPFVTSYGKVRGIGDFTSSTLFPTARPLKILKKLPSNVTVWPIAQTSGESLAVNRQQAEGQRQETSLKGPLNIGLMARGTLMGKPRSGIMVFGDADFLTNAYLNVSANRDLAIHCIDLLVTGGRLAAADPGSDPEQPFVLTPRQGLTIFLAAVVILPSAVLLAGAMLRRRRNGA